MQNEERNKDSLNDFQTEFMTELIGQRLKKYQVMVCSLPSHFASFLALN